MARKGNDGFSSHHTYILLFCNVRYVIFPSIIEQPPTQIFNPVIIPTAVGCPLVPIACEPPQNENLVRYKSHIAM